MDFSVTILGSGAALPALGRFTSAQVVTLGKRQYLIDAGEGVQMQMARHGISPLKLETVFISHLHGDHYLGLMGLLFSMHLHKRKKELHLFGFRGLNEIILLQLKYSNSALTFPLLFHELLPGHAGIVFEDNNMEVQAIPLSHKIPTSGFLFKEKPRLLNLDKSKLKDGMRIQDLVVLKQGRDVIDEGGVVLLRSADYTLPPAPLRRYAYCSDTEYSQSLIPYISGVEVLYHEATFLHEDVEKAVETKHSTARQAGLIATQARVKKLLIGHFSARYDNLSSLLAEAASVFPETALAIEGETFHIER